MATSPAIPTIESVTNLEYYQDGIVYAAEVPSWKSVYAVVAESLDAGVHWELNEEIYSIEMKSLPIQHCGRLYPRICYRLNSYGKLMELGPDGKWKIVEAVNKKGYDMILFDWNNREYVIVAIGKHGLYRRVLPDGRWNVIPVIHADEPVKKK